MFIEISQKRFLACLFAGGVMWRTAQERFYHGTGYVAGTGQNRDGFRDCHFVASGVID